METKILFKMSDVMNYGDKLTTSPASQRIRVPTNRFLRCQYSRQRTATVLAFMLGEKEYAIDFFKVLETRRYESVAKLADMPAFIKGVINLNGNIVPIVDLRARFGVGQVECDDSAEMIILNLDSCIMAIVVDSISDVLVTKCTKINTVPMRISDIDAQFLHGLISADDRKLVLVDIEKLMSDETLISDKEMAALLALTASIEEKRLA
jgi:purine-binding chemotaxis protein CheW